MILADQILKRLGPPLACNDLVLRHRFLYTKDLGVEMVTGHPTSHIVAGTVASFRIWRGSRNAVVQDPASKAEQTRERSISGISAVPHNEPEAQCVIKENRL